MTRRLLPDWSTPHGTVVIVVLLAALAYMSAGCAPRPDAAVPAPAATAPAPPGTGPAAVVADAAGDVAEEVREGVEEAAGDAQRDVAQAIAPAVIAVREVVEAALPPVDAGGPVSATVSPAAVALIVRHEIISESYYRRALQGFACPGDRSGPTCGIGSDLGVQTRATIRDVWTAHPHVERMTTASRQVGFSACRSWRANHADIRTPLPLAREVFASKLLPRYHRMAAQAFRNTWHLLPPDAQGGLTATVYVRGASMEDAPGSQQRKEMRVMRDECGASVQCLAAQHRAMCQRFAGRKDQAGLCRRFNETADLIERSAA